MRTDRQSGLQSCRRVPYPWKGPGTKDTLPPERAWDQRYPPMERTWDQGPGRDLTPEIPFSHPLGQNDRHL